MISNAHFYSEVTGDHNAFMKICKNLPIIVDEILLDYPEIMVEVDTVFEEIKEIDDQRYLSQEIEIDAIAFAHWLVKKELDLKTIIPEVIKEKVLERNLIFMNTYFSKTNE